jgi:hypothetical protein
MGTHIVNGARRRTCGRIWAALLPRKPLQSKQDIDTWLDLVLCEMALSNLPLMCFTHSSHCSIVEKGSRGEPALAVQWWAAINWLKVLSQAAGKATWAMMHAGLAQASSHILDRPWSVTCYATCLRGGPLFGTESHRQVLPPIIAIRLTSFIPLTDGSRFSIASFGLFNCFSATASDSLSTTFPR